MSEPTFEPLRSFRERPPEEMRRRAAAFHEEMAARRSVPAITRKSLEDIAVFR